MRSSSSPIRCAKPSLDAVQSLDATRNRTKKALATLRAHDAALAAHTEQVNRATVRHEAALAECDRLAAALAQAAAAVDEAQSAARVADDRLNAALEAPRPMLDASAREGMLAELEAARDGEMRARLDVETLQGARARGRSAGGRSSNGSASGSGMPAAEAARRAVIRRAQRDVAARRRRPAAAPSWIPSTGR